ncbi:MAG: AtpZ/AtpI family protein [Holosporales bacterium]|nr:AtpZ/AtpI family protein [Holosporales bacterium]
MTERGFSPKKRVSNPEKQEKMENAYSSLGVFWSLGWRVAIEWGAAVCVGGFLGSLLDDFFDSDPLCFVGGLFLGTMAGILSIYMEFPLLKTGKKSP